MRSSLLERAYGAYQTTFTNNPITSSPRRSITYAIQTTRTGRQVFITRAYGLFATMKSLGKSFKGAYTTPRSFRRLIILKIYAAFPSLDLTTLEYSARSHGDQQPYQVLTYGVASSRRLEQSLKLYKKILNKEHNDNEPEGTHHRSPRRHHKSRTYG